MAALLFFFFLTDCTGTSTRIIKSAITGQSKVALERRNTQGKNHKQITKKVQTLASKLPQVEYRQFEMNGSSPSGRFILNPVWVLPGRWLGSAVFFVVALRLAALLRWLFCTLHEGGDVGIDTTTMSSETAILRLKTMRQCFS